MLCVLRRLCVPGKDRDDLAQEVLFAAHRRLPSFERGRPLRPWLHGIAFNVAKRHRARAHNRREVLMDDEFRELMVRGPDPEDATAERKYRELLFRLMQGLDLDHRAVVSMHIDGTEMADIARELGIALATAYKRLETARAKLQAALARTQRAPRKAGAAVVPLTLDGLFAAERNAPDDIPESVVDRLRARLRDAVLAAPALRSALTRGLVTGAVGGVVAGGAAGAALMYHLLMGHAEPSAAAIASSAPSAVPAGAIASAVLSPPATSAATEPAPPAISSQATTARGTAAGRAEDEETLIQTARMAYAHGETAQALDALNRHARRYPRGELAVDREALRGQVLEHRRVAGAASAAPSAGVAPGASAAPRRLFGVEE